jgi:hypothetical protein
MNKVKNKREYLKPAMQVYKLKKSPQLLVGSGVGDPNDYPNQGNPWQNP